MAEFKAGQHIEKIVNSEAIETSLIQPMFYITININALLFVLDPVFVTSDNLIIIRKSEQRRITTTQIFTLKTPFKQALI